MIDQITDFSKYLSILNENATKYIIIICARDNIGRLMPEAIADALLTLGLTSDLHRTRGLGGKSHRGYIAIIDGGVLVTERLGSPQGENVWHESEKYRIKSAVYHKLRYEDSEIVIRGMECCTNVRGLNFVVLDKSNGEFVDAVGFDCHLNEIRCVRTINLTVLRDYAQWRTKSKPKKLPKLALYRPNYPYGEMAVVHREGASIQNPSDLSHAHSGAGPTLAAFAAAQNMQWHELGEASIVGTLDLLTDREGTQYMFSGLARWKDKLVLGVNDIKTYGIAVSELREATGEFELLTYDGKRLELSTDFFGMCQWYYYKADGLFVGATSYHLLLLTLKELGVQMRLDVRKVAAGMAFFGGFCENSFIERMDVEGCFEVPPDERIIIYSRRSPNV